MNIVPQLPCSTLLQFSVYLYNIYFQYLKSHHPSPFSNTKEQFLVSARVPSRKHETRLTEIHCLPSHPISPVTRGRNLSSTHKLVANHTCLPSKPAELCPNLRLLSLRALLESEHRSSRRLTLMMRCDAMLGNYKSAV